MTATAAEPRLARSVPADLRAALAGLGPGELVRVSEEVPARYGVAERYAAWAGVPASPPTGPGPAVLFERVVPAVGPPRPVLLGLYGSRRRAAALLALSPADVPFRLLEAIAAPVAARLGPATEHEAQPIDLRLLPIPVLSDEDAGPYLTLGAVVATHPDTGVRNLSVHRMCVQDRDRLTIWMVPRRHLEQAYLTSLSRGEPLPVSIHLGLSPAIMLSSCVPSSLVTAALDELGLAGALLGEPVGLEPGRTGAAPFIAHAEYVIEGEMVAEQMPENPAGAMATAEFLGYPGRANPSLPIIRVTGITARPGALLQSVSGPGLEQSTLLGFGMEAAVIDHLRRQGAPIQGAHCHTAGGGQLMMVLQWAAKREADDDHRRRAASASVLEEFRMVKLIVAVDDDVDIESDQDLWWAMTTRMQADQDLVVLADREGFPLDPSQHPAYSATLSGPGRTAKVVFDCTIPFGLADQFRRSSFTTSANRATPSVIRAGDSAA